MLDVVQHQVRTTVQSSTGAKTVTYVTGRTFQCSIDMGGSHEVTAHGTTLVTDAVGRLPLDAPVHAEDRLVVLEKYQQILVVPVTYYIVSEPAVGPTAIVCNLKDIRL
jgi:hypothetical protein